MTELREEKLARVRSSIPPVVGVREDDADILVLGWGSTYGAIRAGVRNANRDGSRAAHLHIRHLSPLPPDLGEILARYDTVLVPELNRGQLLKLVRAEYLVPAVGLHKVQGLPFKAAEIAAKIHELTDAKESGVTDTDTRYCRQDFQSDQEVRWCPGCGDYTILATVQSFLAGVDVDRHKHVFVSGIGCAARFPYYVDTYGMHSIHGRAPAVATGVATANPDLTVWVVTGDGDALSIGGNHLIHALRRNVNIKILLFNNQIYGLTKGQYSPTSEVGKRDQVEPGGIDRLPVQPGEPGAGRRGHVRRPHRRHGPRARHPHPPGRLRAHRLGLRRDLPELQRVQRQGVHQAHRAGGARRQPHLPRARRAHRVRGREGEGHRPRPGRRQDRRRRRRGSRRHPRPRPGQHGRRGLRAEPAAHGPTGPTPIGVFRQISRPSYQELVQSQIIDAQAKKGPGDLGELLRSAGTWSVS